jgi:hypothetical protein
MERWGALECRLDVRDVEDSESVRDGSSLFVILGRLLRGGGGPGRQISMIQGQIKNKMHRGDQSRPPRRNRGQIVLSS